MQDLIRTNVEKYYKSILAKSWKIHARLFQDCKNYLSKILQELVRMFLLDS